MTKSASHKNKQQQEQQQQEQQHQQGQQSRVNFCNKMPEHTHKSYWTLPGLHSLHFPFPICHNSTFPTPSPGCIESLVFQLSAAHKFSRQFLLFFSMWSKQHKLCKFLLFYFYCPAKCHSVYIGLHDRMCVCVYIAFPAKHLPICFTLLFCRLLVILKRFFFPYAKIKVFSPLCKDLLTQRTGC